MGQKKLGAVSLTVQGGLTFAVRHQEPPPKHVLREKKGQSSQGCHPAAGFT
jgi:hypothetical protein